MNCASIVEISPHRDLRLYLQENEMRRAMPSKYYDSQLPTQTHLLGLCHAVCCKKGTWNLLGF